MNRVTLNTVGLNTVMLPTVGLPTVGWPSARKGGGIPAAIRRAMVLWYDIERQGCTNESMAENPILKDLSGNGYDARCYNFGWEGMSGVGGYVTNYTDYHQYTDRGSVVAEPTKIIIEKVVSTEALIETIENIGEIPSYKIRVSGIPEGITLCYMYYQEEGIRSQFDIAEDGEYVLPANINNCRYVGFKIINFTGDCNITIEQLPLYPNALVSDGVDDYCLAPTIPSLDSSQGFTIIAKREAWEDGTSYAALASKMTDASETMGAFIIERINSTGEGTHINVFGSNTPISHGKKSGVMYCTSKNYNGETALTSGGNPDSNSLVLFKFDCSETAQYCGRYALYSFMLFDRDLTEDEINWVKTNLIEKK